MVSWELAELRGVSINGKFGTKVWSYPASTVITLAFVRYEQSGDVLYCVVLHRLALTPRKNHKKCARGFMGNWSNSSEQGKENAPALRLRDSPNKKKQTKTPHKELPGIDDKHGKGILNLPGTVSGIALGIPGGYPTVSSTPRISVKI